MTSSTRQQPLSRAYNSDGSGEPSRAWRGFFAASLAMAMGMGIFAIMCIAAFAPLVVEDLGLTRAQLGSIATVGFAAAALTSGPSGRWVGVARSRTVMYTVFGIGALAVVAMAAAQTLVWLWVAATLCGASQAIANVITNQLVAEHIPHGQQGVQIGVKQSGPPLSQSFIGFVLPPLAVVVGWRWAVLTGAALGIAGMVATRLVVPDTDPPMRQKAAQGRGGHDRMVLRFAVYAFTVAMAIQPVLTYVPLYAFQRVDLPAAVAGMTAGVIGLAGIAARIGWGRMTEHRDDPLQALTILSAVSFLAVVSILISEYVGAWSLWLGLVGFGGSAMAATSVIMLALVRLSGTTGTGRASGVVVRGLFMGGLAAPVAFGFLVDQTDSYTMAWGAVAAVLFIQGVLTVLWRRNAAPPAGA